MRGLSPDEVKAQAQRGRDTFRQVGRVPENSVEALAIAREIRLSGYLGQSAAKLVDVENTDEFYEEVVNTSETFTKSE